jgi:acetyltransferase-like isoleucine patch superfamily enzyme
MEVITKGKKVNIFYKIKNRSLDFYSHFKLKIKKTIRLEKNVKVNFFTSLEDNIKIYHDTKILSTLIGRGTYIGWNAILNNVKIGRFCSIAPFVEVVYGKHAINEFVSSHPAFYSPAKQAGFTFTPKAKFEEVTYACKKSAYRVVIGNDVWIGYGVKIMEGVTIGDGAIIGAGSIVTKDIEPYCIYVGVPAKKLKERFPPETIKSLLEVRWWDKDFEWLKQNNNLFKYPNEVISVLQSND